MSKSHPFSHLHESFLPVGKYPFSLMRTLQNLTPIFVIFRTLMHVTYDREREYRELHSHMIQEPRVMFISLLKKKTIKKT